MGVRRSEQVVVPLIPEFIRNEEGGEQYDGERDAAKRWISKKRGRHGRWEMADMPGIG
jgi:hypothetical protein